MNLAHQQVGSGELTFLFLHGNSSSSSSFIHQLNSSLKEEYILHAVDLPGHGNSPKAVDINVYSMPGYAKAIFDHIEKHDLKNIILVGWSLGGHIALEMAAKSDQFKGFIIFGTPPLGIPAAMEQAFLPNEAVSVGFTPELDEIMATSYATALFQKNTTIDLQSFVEDILKTDGNARAFLVPSMSTIGYEDEIKAIANLSVPIMIIHGRAEQLVSSDYIATLTIPSLWQGAIQYLDNAGHAPQVEVPTEFNALLNSFASQLT